MNTATARQIINPAVYSHAECFTDGRITDRLLADVAAMERLPLYVDVASLPPVRAVAARQVPTALDAATAEVARWTAAVEAGRSIYCAARAGIGFANRGYLAFGGGDRRSFVGVRLAKIGAFRTFARARHSLARNERNLAAAQAALAALAPPALALAA